MIDTRSDLSARYYVAEVSVWVLGAILLVSRFIGLASDQSLPVLNVTLQDSQQFSRVVAALLGAALLYLIFEWMQSSTTARASRWAKARSAGTILWACTSFWLSYALIAQHTRFAGVSPAWYLGFILIGFLLGTSVSVLAFSALMIRTRDEASRLRLPQIPAATRAQFVAWPPVVISLIVVYYVILGFSPAALHELAAVLVAIPFLAMLGEMLASLYLARDEHGVRIPYAQRIAGFKEIHDAHDYSYLLSGVGAELAKVLKSDLHASPQEIQKAMQQEFSAGNSPDHGKFHVETLEEMQISFYAKDGNPDNKSPENLGIRIHKRGGKRALLRVAVILNDPQSSSREMEIPVARVEAHAEEYLSSHPNDKDFRRIFSYAINQSVIKTMTSEAEPLLHRAVAGGDEGNG